MQAKQIDMMSKVPDVLKDVREIKALINTENSEMNLLSAADMHGSRTKTAI